MGHNLPCRRSWIATFASITALSLLLPAAGPPATPPVIPKILSLKVTPAAIHAGDEVTVSWTTRGADSVMVEWRPVANASAPSDGRDGLPPSGSFSVRLTESSLFVLSCRNPAGLCSRSITARVKVRQ